jgi:hypothetical protein
LYSIAFKVMELPAVTAGVQVMTKDRAPAKFPRNWKVWFPAVVIPLRPKPEIWAVPAVSLHTATLKDPPPDPTEVRPRRKVIPVRSWALANAQRIEALPGWSPVNALPAPPVKVALPLATTIDEPAFVAWRYRSAAHWPPTPLGEPTLSGFAELTAVPHPSHVGDPRTPPLLTEPGVARLAHVTKAAFAEPATATAAIEAIIEEVRIWNILGQCPC